MPGVVEGEHVQGIEHEERRPGERRFAHAAGQLGHGVVGPVIGCRDAASFDGHASPQLGGVRLGVAGGRLGRGDGVEHRERLVGAPLDAEGAGELRRHHGAQVRAVRVVVGGLTEPLLARPRIAEVPQAVDQLLFTPPVLGRFGGQCVGRVIHPSIMAAVRPRRYASGSMTRIIAGFAGSLSLQVPRSGTRPTSDRVREAIFSALESRDAIDGAAVLDLYAGSGALGLEAVSRGAAEAVLVERAKPAADICRRNADALKRAARGHPRGCASCRSRSPPISRAPAGRSTWSSSTRRTTSPRPRSRDDLALLAPLLADEAVVVVERSSRSAEPEWPAGISPDAPPRLRRDHPLVGDRRAHLRRRRVTAADDQPARPSQPA